MTLGQFHDLKQWHMRHWRDKPVERHGWDVVVTLWLLGWVGLPAGALLGVTWAELGCLSLLFLPSAYAQLRLNLHRSGRLRCDWLVALR